MLKILPSEDISQQKIHTINSNAETLPLKKVSIKKTVPIKEPPPPDLRYLNWEADPGAMFLHEVFDLISRKAEKHYDRSQMDNNLESKEKEEIRKFYKMLKEHSGYPNRDKLKKK